MGRVGSRRRAARAPITPAAQMRYYKQRLELGHLNVTQRA